MALAGWGPIVVGNRFSYTRSSSYRFKCSVFPPLRERGCRSPPWSLSKPGSGDPYMMHSCHRRSLPLSPPIHFLIAVLKPFDRKVPPVTFENQISFELFVFAWFGPFCP